ncbi:hypothetical protein [Akkermansia muciniphila]|uniref:hypothetical protein n=2 Tax=Akkermansia TaxID=239934 RepID=UPI0011AEDC23|nr:hypothetical protein [Akkermansia muciniphila]
MSSLNRMGRSFTLLFMVRKLWFCFIIHNGCNSGFSEGCEGVVSVVWPDSFSVADNEIFFKKIRNIPLNALKIQVQRIRYLLGGVYSNSYSRQRNSFSVGKNRVGIDISCDG